MNDYLQTPLWNPALTAEERLCFLLSQLTMEEKLQCMGTGCPAISRLGIPAFSLGGEGAHGVQARHDQKWDQQSPEYTTIFPNPIGMSATWDIDLIRKAGQVTGTEARGLYVAGLHRSLSLWAPTIDMERDPRWGRTEEGYGEDPVLAGEMAGAYVEGMQGENPDHLLTAATVKHFYANNVEVGRCWKSSEIDERNREEYYLEPFRRVIQDYGADGLMTAYNEVNGIPCMLNTEVRTRAREQWGLRHVVCDGGDVSQTVDLHQYFTDHAETIAGGLQAGIDCFTDDIALVSKAAARAYEQGMISEEQIDEALFRHFGVMLRLGLFDPPGTNPYEQIGIQDVGTPEHHQIARELAEESVVLLQNDGILPLASNQSVAVVGPLADVWYKDWYSGIPPYYVTPAQGIQDAFGERISVVENGMETVRIRLDSQLVTFPEKNYLGLDEADGTLHAVTREQAELFRIEYWGEGRTTLRACSNDKFLRTEDAADKGETGLIRAASDEAFGWFVKEVFQLYRKEERFDGILRESMRENRQSENTADELVNLDGKPDQSTFDALVHMRKDSGALHLYAWNGAKIRFDDQGRCCVYVDAADTGVKSHEDGRQDSTCNAVLKEGVGDVPETHQSDGGKKERAAGEDTENTGLDEIIKKGEQEPGTLGIHLEIVRDGITEAVRAASQADIVVLYLGAHPMITCKEEVDRTTLDLPPYQQAMLEAVFRANSKTVLALVSSVPFAIGWAKQHIPAILVTATGGMELGHGIANVLTGAVSPAARLPMTWYRTEQDLPPMDDYDIIQGERTYQYFPGEVLYSFGHGLSYGKFQYDGLKIQKIEEPGTDENGFGALLVSVTIQNISEVTADEVVQIYGRKVGSVVKRPRRTLLAFQREKQMSGGESREITFRILLYDLSYYSVEKCCRVLEPGRYEIFAGASSEDLRQRMEFEV